MGLGLMNVLLCVCICIVFNTLFSLGVSKAAHFDAIYQFGDSISDTGNDVQENPKGACGQPPYGKTFFPHPTGRCSDGRLIVDFIAQAVGLPLLNPYLSRGSSFNQGVNFAVAGATALNVSTLAAKNITATATHSTLLVQLDWFKSHLNTLCKSPSECNGKLANSLFMVGEIGGNDYNAATFGGKSMDVLRALVPDVVQMISNVVQAVIGLGAKHVIVPGNFPVGCMTVYLAAFKSSDPTMYDEVNCLKAWNDLSAFHNTQLQTAIKTLQTNNPAVSIVYGDYFNAMKSILAGATSLGFDKDVMFKACCGTGDGKNDYNFNPAMMCGSGGVPACPDPTKHVSWDGIHLTEHVYGLMANSIFKQILPTITKA